jgi:hypothetical protein
LRVDVARRPVLILTGCEDGRPSIELKRISRLLSQKDKSLAQPVKQFWSRGLW